MSSTKAQMRICITEKLKEVEQKMFYAEENEREILEIFRKDFINTLRLLNNN